MKRALLFAWLCAAILTAAWSTGCAPSRRGEPFTHDPNVANPKLALGQRVFYRNCNVCHPGGAAGYGPSLADQLLPGFYINIRVRDGLGAMPPFDENRLPQAQLDAVVLYIQALHAL